MKLPFTIYDLRFTIREESAGRAVRPLTAAGAHGVTRPAALNRQSSIINHKSQSGVALVLTLILLSVALVMTLAFLAISSREQDSVTTQTDTATMRLAADAGLAAAEAQIAANVLSTTNPYNFGLLVSTNYPPFAYTNPVDFAALQFSPRTPVWLSNTVTHAMENRFYFDLNRNGVDDPSGLVFDPATGATSFQVGDPEWIGVLEHPDQPYGPNNHFIARFAFIALPVGNSLDLNAIDNQTLNRALDPLNDGYFRNQGVGTWEINLPAFLTDLNTNQWDPNTDAYNYLQPGFHNVGRGFEDAFALLTNRYAGNYNTLSPVAGSNPRGLFTTANNFPPFQNNIDAYTMGPLQTTPAGINVNPNVTLPWAGADNTNHWFTPDDLFDPAKSSAGFTGRLLNAGSGVSTYDRYTFYRLLAQAGTDTAPESGKMNLNYDNLDPAVTLVGVNLVTNPPSATNFMAWTPLAFFTSAADRLLKAYTAQWAVTYTNFNGVLVPGVSPNFVATFNVTAPFGVSSIPVLVSNRFVYTPAVNRLLQLAANMYDATTTSNYPDIFRPLFTVVQGKNGYYDVYITGYTNLNTLNPNGPVFIDRNSQMAVGGNNGVLDPPIDATTLAANATIIPVINQPVNVYGVPWIIGAKKGFPNFNAFSIESAFQLVRKLDVERDLTAATQPDILWTNQMYMMNITNYFALSCWNSYQTNYPGPVDIVVRCGSTVTLTNDNNMAPAVFPISFAFAHPVTPYWPAWNGTTKSSSGSFIVPLNTSVLTLSNAIYYYGGAQLAYYVGDNPANYVDKGIRPLPHFWLLMTNRLQVAIIDYSAGPSNGRIVDYVQLGGMDSSQLLNSALPENDPNSLWNTNYDSQGNLLGVYNQIHVSMNGTTISGQTPTGSGTWSTAQIPGLSSDVSPQAQQAFFRAFFAQNSYDGYGGGIYNSWSAMQVPYTPMAFAVQHTTWAANDPLVYYLASDLAPYTQNLQAIDWSAYNPQVTSDRYQPWGMAPSTYETGIDQNPANPGFKDPLVRGSDNWDFPTNKLPTVGWLGRVHRGTPWQTVYLKSTNVLAWANNVGQSGINTWINRTGDGNFFDAINSSPVEDRLLFDLFTTAINDNSTRGQLSVNVGSNSLAAWSAAFSGVTVFSNNLPNFVVGLASQPRYQKPLPSQNPPVYTNLVIAPAGVNGNNSALAQIVAGIDRTRATFRNADGLVGAFEHKGDILATPQLAEQAPFLNWNNAAQKANGISDEMYEWLPQQAMSLLSVSSSPRYVIYTYGQALKPAKNGTYLGGGAYFGMVTNYQVVSEIATRAVLRLETVRTNAIDVNGANSTIFVTPPRAVIESFNLLPPD